MLSKEEQHDLEIYKKNDLLDPQIAGLFINFCRLVIQRDYENRREVLDVAHKLRDDILKKVMEIVHTDKSGLVAELYQTYNNILLMEAQNRQVDAYFLYLEKNREPKEKFYQPRRKVFLKHGIIQGFQDLIDDNLDILCISLPPGTGKAQPLYSKILTPEGFKRMCDISVGDKVIAGNGKVANVIGVYPQGVMPIYELTFDDGSKCRCSDNHLWTVQTRDDRNKKIYPSGKYRTIELSEIRKKLYVENNKRTNYSVDYVPQIDFPERTFIIHPYILGVLIGDGCLSSGSPNIALGDLEIIDNINQFLPEGYTVTHNDKCTYRIKGHEGNNAKAGSLISKGLKQYGLWGKRSHEKFIPHDYLTASYQQRLWLLRGLMDTDGSAEKVCANYSTSSEQLALDVVELVHSLGGYASVVRRDNCGYKKNGVFIECKDSYRVTIEFPKDHNQIFAIERKRSIYVPKREEIKRFIKDVKYVGDEECQCIMIDDPCHLYITDNYIITHNTTAEKFFHSAVVGWFPSDYSLFYSHSGDITRMYYDGVYQIVTDSQEYTWGEVFPGLKVTSTNAKSQQFNVGKYKPFPSLQTASVGSENAGKVRASKFLLVDDMIGKLEEALNKNILDKLWSAYAVDARQRKTNGTDGKFCKEIHIATRWSVHDVIGRIQRAYEGNPRVRAIAVPDIDPETGESNFLYDIGGFTAEDFKDQELLMDEISYRCLYKQDPIEREGLLYHPDEVRTYSSLPDKEPDAILAICDTKNTGTDYMFVPCFKQYGDDFYLIDCVCDNGVDFDVLFDKITRLIVDNGVQKLEIESNQGGKPIGTTIRNMIEAEGWTCNITEKPTETNKESRIIANSYWVKKHVLFKEKGDYPPMSEYGVMMSELFSWTQVGKNPHDDIPDCLANFALFVQRNTYTKATIIKSPF